MNAETTAPAAPTERLTTLLGIAHPLILGPMRLITLGAMAAEVSNSGGLGVIAGSGLSAEQLRRELDTAATRTERPLAVNIPIYRPNAEEAMDIALEKGVAVIYTSAGNPAKFLPRLKEAGVTVIHKVSNEKMAVKAEAAGVDAVVAMGYEAGGHVGRGNNTTFCLIPRLTDILTIPVIAAGGVADGRGLLAALALGAAGVEIGTRLVGSTECPVPDFFKEAIQQADGEATLLLGKGAMPIRVLKNRVTMEVSGMTDTAADQAMEKAGDAVYVQSGGDRETAVMPCGQAASLIREIAPVREILQKIMTETIAVRDQLQRIKL